MVVCFDLTQHFTEQVGVDDYLIENAVLLVEGREIPFKLRREGTPNLAQVLHENTFRRGWHFQIMLSAEEILLMRNAVIVSVRWNQGSFDLNQSGLEILRRFLDEEIPMSSAGN